MTKEEQEKLEKEIEEFLLTDESRRFIEQETFIQSLKKNRKINVINELGSEAKIIYNKNNQ